MTSVTDPPAFVCPRTGLGLVSIPNQLTHRVASKRWGVMNPRLRPEGSGSLTTDWGRFDSAGHRTIYAASTPKGAYLESLAWAYITEKDRESKTAELVDALDDDERLFLDQVSREWEEAGHLRVGVVPPSWRTSKKLHDLQLPDAGYFIDLYRADTLHTISTKLSSRLADLGVTMLTQSELYGSRRDVTTAIALWLRGRILYDETSAVGIRYRSKYGEEFQCYAIWLRVVDDGGNVADEPIRQVGEREILATDPDLLAAAEYLNLIVM